MQSFGDHEIRVKIIWRGIEEDKGKGGTGLF
jgi:hypothetical protein